MGATFFIITCLISLAIVTATETTTTREISDCYANNENYQNWVFQNALPKIMQYLGQLMSSNFEQILPAVNVTKWDMYCRELGIIRTCINGTNNPTEAKEKRLSLAALEKISSIICDADIKEQFPCLFQLSQNPSPVCQTKCAQYKLVLNDAISEFGDNDTVSMNKIRSVCQFVNCRWNCRKADIVATCRQQGLEATKKLLRAIGSMVEMANQERGTNDIPFALDCTSNGLTKEERSGGS